MVLTPDSIKTLLKDYRMLNLIFGTNSSTYSKSESEQLTNFIRLNNSLQILKKLPENGSIYYQIIFHCYLSSEPLESTYDIIDALNTEGIFLSLRSYYRKKKQAIELISRIMST